MGLNTQACLEGVGKRALIVLGMHRSGTSSVAGVLTMLGAAPPRTLMVAAADNPKGFFESRLIGELNDRILQSAGSSWDDWRRFDQSILRPGVVAASREEIRATVTMEFADAPLVVLKDPRLCRLYPIWEGVLEDEGYEVDFVLPIRSPLEVARSLNRRNGMPIAGGLLLWLRHVLEAEKLTRLKRRRILLWRAFMQDWRSEIALVQQQLDWDVEVTEARSREIDAFLSVDLQHEIVPDASLISDPEAHAWAVEAYDAFTGLASPQNRTSFELARLDRVRSAVEVACQLYARAYQPLVQRIGQLEAELTAQSYDSESRASDHRREAQSAQDMALVRRQQMERAGVLTENLAQIIAAGGPARNAFETALKQSQVHARRIRSARNRYSAENA